MTPALRVLIVSDNLLSRAGLSAILDTHDSLLIVGQTTTESLSDDIGIYQADIVLIDLGWQVSDQLEALSILQDVDIPTLALITDENDASSVLNLLNQGGVYGLLLNENDSDMLLMALQTVAGGLIVIDPILAPYLHTSSITPQPLVEELTQRENEVLQLLAQGLTNKGIAHQLGITDHTVKFHVNAIMTKLGAQSRTEAVVTATRAGLIIL
ncbi:MAG: response regulator transcription factor [Phototrophicaceae bacterium]